MKFQNIVHIISHTPALAIIAVLPRADFTQLFVSGVLGSITSSQLKNKITVIFPFEAQPCMELFKNDVSKQI